jgi:hypothetical protein
MKITKEQIELSTVRMLTLNEPFASLMAFHGKWETRKRDTNVRGLVCIHAAKLPYKNQTILDISGKEQFDRIQSLVPYRLTNRSKIIAIANLVNTFKMDNSPIQKSALENICFVKYNDELWVWVFENITPVQPFYIKGKQGWKILTDAEKSQINPL